jgi:hypothetical protein
VPRRWQPILLLGPPQNPQPAGSIQLHRFFPTVRYRDALTAGHIAKTKRVLTLGHLPDAHPVLAPLAANDSLEDQAVAKVAVYALIERPRQSNPRLNRHHTRLPVNLVHSSVL